MGATASEGEVDNSGMKKAISFSCSPSRKITKSGSETTWIVGSQIHDRVRPPSLSVSNSVIEVINKSRSFVFLGKSHERYLCRNPALEWAVRVALLPEFLRVPEVKFL